jgi:DtxR family Mn-dependent transcriptional regulator
VASQTVENYLKAIYLAQQVRGDAGDLVPMGQLSAALGVVPGTATAMVKALADSGLARWEPYSGVRLTAAGEKLAALVLRRHRLIELFLVQVMGMSWAEVHDEAEQLEHAVSDRLITRIDGMLGYPHVDPHGDPIPDADGTVAAREAHSLLTCPLGTPLRVSRVVDQGAEFLRFIEQHDLKPGRVIEIETRDVAADSVLVRSESDRRVTLGARAASKLLVQTLGAMLAVLLTALGVAAQPAPASLSSSRPFEILDNSFLVEEAFNEEGPGRPAFSPRVSLVAPSGSSARGLGGGSPGVQVNLPFSKQARDVFWHWNAGFTWLPFADANLGVGRRAEANLFSPFLAASAIWRARPMLHLMLEHVLVFEHAVVAPLKTNRSAHLTVSPGLRCGWNFGDRQLVVGLAAPVTFDGGATAAALGYLSYELPFRQP